MRFSVVIGLVLLQFSTSFCGAADKPQFADVVIDKQFQPYLLSNPLLMEFTGAKVVRDRQGRTILLSVASTVLKNDSPAERLRAEKVCKAKTFAGMVAEKHGVQVCHVETLNEKTVVVIDAGGETGKNVSELLQVTQTKIEGITKDMPVIGRWKSNSGDVFYVAVGVILDKNGEPLVQDE